jgi:enediyne biosynthesis protein E5
MTIKSFFRTPKGIVLIILAVLTLIASFRAGIANVAPGLLGAIVVACAIDIPVRRAREGQWVFPSGAILTALIVAMILSPTERPVVAIVTTAVAVASKYLLRANHANIFNPAALALVATYYLFDSEHSWWGALPDLPSIALVILIASGLYITRRLNKMPSVLAFLGAYYLFFTLAAFAGPPASVAVLFRSPDLHAALYFAFFMVTDPPTSPTKHRDQIIYGVITAAGACIAYETVGAAYFLLAGLLVANVWESWRRSRLRAARGARSPSG